MICRRGEAVRIGLGRVDGLVSAPPCPMAGRAGRTGETGGDKCFGDPTKTLPPVSPLQLAPTHLKHTLCQIVLSVMLPVPLGRFAPVIYVQLGQNPADMGLDRCDTQDQPRGDFLVGQAIGNEMGDFQLFG